MFHIQKTSTKDAQIQPCQLSDEELVRIVLKGNKELFAELLSRHQRGVFNYILRMVGQYDVAADLSQDVFMKIYCALDTYNSRHKFSTWIFSIASHFTIDYLRKKKIAAVSYEASHADQKSSLKDRLKSRAISPLEEIKNNELKKKIQDSIKNLDPEYREVIVLRHLHGFSYEDISTITGLPLGTIKNRIFRARQILKELLASYIFREIA